MNRISVITLAPRGAEKTSALLIRLDAIFANDKSRYEILFVDEGIDLEVVREVEKYGATFPVKCIGPDYPIKSLRFETVAFLGDMVKYSPEALDKLIAKLHKSKADFVVGVKNGVVRTAYNLLKSSLISLPSRYSPKQIGQAQLIVGKRSAMTHLGDVGAVRLHETGIIHRLRGSSDKVICSNVAKVKSPTINYQETMFQSYYNTLYSSVKGLVVPDNYNEFDEKKVSDRGKGFYYQGKEYVTHNSLTRRSSAVERTTPWQRFIIAMILMVLLIFAAVNGHALLVFVVSLMTVLYFCDLLFNVFLIYRSFKSYSEITIEDAAIHTKRSWPTYTILCPLYKETLVIPQFVAAMGAIDYPREKLEVMLLLEQDDTESIKAIKDLRLPEYFKLIVVPDSMPKTKPKACNYGLQRATGEYAVIYDAEDLPDPLQLKKAVIAFETGDKNVECIQAKLNYYNWDQNLLTRLFTLEYSLWFNLILTGLQSIKAPIPLGGTSNHFRTKVLRKLGGWDPFNVTEDADLGIRLAKRGMKTAVLDSTTLEEANSEVRNWLKQRSRWIKGYMQTYLVHMRSLREFGRNSSRIDMITFQLVIGGKILSMLINPILWIMTLSYFLLRPQIGPVIESLYLAPIFYIGAISLVIGNFMYLYYYMMGAARQNKPELVIYALFVPIYWIMMSIAAVYALRDLIIRPFHWHKTKHGLHLKKHKAKAA